MKNLNTTIKNKKINMKQLYLIIVGCLLFLTQASANNLVLGTTQYIDSYTNAGVTYKALRFTITWDNSWSITTGPANWDGVWVFVKRQNCSGTNNWVHQKLGTTAGDHIAKNGAGNTSPEVQVDPVSDGMGVFIRRQGSNVTGTVPVTTVWLKLDVSGTGNFTGLLTTNGGITVPSGKTLTISSGATLTIASGATSNLVINALTPLVLATGINFNLAAGGSTYVADFTSIGAGYYKIFVSPAVNPKNDSAYMRCCWPCGETSRVVLAIWGGASPIARRASRT
jgi:hypothetical protein